MARLDIEALSALIDLMRRKGVQVLKHDGTEILLGPEPEGPPRPGVVIENDVPRKDPLDAYDEALFGPRGPRPEEH